MPHRVPAMFFIRWPTLRLTEISFWRNGKVQTKHLHLGILNIEKQTSNLSIKCLINTDWTRQVTVEDRENPVNTKSSNLAINHRPIPSANELSIHVRWMLGDAEFRSFKLLIEFYRCIDRNYKIHLNLIYLSWSSHWVICS